MGLGMGGLDMQEIRKSFFFLDFPNRERQRSVCETVSFYEAPPVAGALFWQMPSPSVVLALRGHLRQQSSFQVPALQPTPSLTLDFPGAHFRTQTPPSGVAGRLEGYAGWGTPA